MKATGKRGKSYNTVSLNSNLANINTNIIYNSLDDIPYPSIGYVNVATSLGPSGATSYLCVSIGTKGKNSHSLIFHRISTNEIFCNASDGGKWSGWKTIK